MPLFFLAFCAIIVSATSPIHATKDDSRLETVYIEYFNDSELSGSETVLVKESDATLATVLRQATGIQSNQSGDRAQLTQISIRGASIGSTAVYLDGVPINDLAGVDQGFDFSALPATLVERVKILRRPQTGRWGGRGSMGAVLLYSKNVKNAHNKIEFGTGSGSLLEFGVTKKTLGNKVLFLINHNRLNAISAADTGDPNAETDGSSDWSGLVKYATEIEKLKFSSALNFSHREIDIDRGGGPGNDDPNARQVFDLGGISFVVSQNFSKKTKWYLTSSYNRLDRITINPEDTTQSSALHFESESHRAYTEARLETWANKRSRWEFGFQLEKENAGIVSETGFSPYQKNQFERKTSDFYVEYGFLKKSLQVKVSARNESVFGVNLELYGKGQQLSLGVARSQLRPSLYQLYDPTYGNSTIQPESLSGVDVEYLVQIGTRRIQLSAFEYRVKNLIDFDTTYVNIGESKLSGVEAKFFSPLFNSGKLEVFASWQNALDTETELRLLRRSHHMYGTKIAFSIFNNWLSAFSWKRYGERPDVDAETFERVTNKPVQLVSLELQRKFSSWSLYLEGNNLLNERVPLIDGYSRWGRHFRIGGSYCF